MRLEMQKAGLHTWHCPTATLLLNAAFGAPGVVHVDPSAHPHFQTGSALHPYSTLAEAVCACHKGATILLLPGRYPSLRLQHLRCPFAYPLHIRGLSADSVLIGEARAPGGPASGRPKWVLRLENCCNLTISQVTLSNAVTGLQVDDDCVFIRV